MPCALPKRAEQLRFAIVYWEIEAAHMDIYNDPKRLPFQLWIVRHGQSAGNVARDDAHRSELNRVNIEGRDVDVPLSALGEQQSAAIANWFLKNELRPEVVLSSPYRRAIDTAQILIDAKTPDTAFTGVVIDERLREKEFGILDGLTTAGVKRLQPEQAASRAMLGKFYYRPPGGESWCDVILRLRSMLDTLSLHYSGKRVLIVTHQVVVLCLRYLLEGLNEAQILEIDRQADVANCSVTEYRRESDGGFRMVRYNYVSPLLTLGTPVTAASDKKGVAP
jgi:broad specificity phosphatase PhoE